MSQLQLVAAVNRRLNNLAMASELWQRLRAVRKHAGMSGEAFGAEFGVSKAAVSQWEASDPAKRTSPDLQKIIDMARRFDVPLDWLLDERADVAREWWIQSDAPPSPPAAPELKLAEALPVVLEAIAACQERDELRQLLPLLVTGAHGYRERITELLTGADGAIGKRSAAA